MDSHRLAKVLSLALLFSNLIGALVRAADNSIPGEANLAWKKSEAFYGEFEAQFELSNVVASSQRHVVQKGKILSSPTLFLVDCVGTGTGDGREAKSKADVRGYNPRYMFVLKHGLNNEWVIDGVRPLSASFSLEQADRAVGVSYQPFLKAHYCLGDLPLSKAFARTDIVVDKVTTTKEGGAPRVNVAFSCTCKDDKSPMRFLKSGTLSLDPDNSWIIRRAKYVAEQNGVSFNSELRTSFKDSGEAFLLPVKVTRHVSQGAVVHEQHFTFLAYTNRPIKEAEVALAAYGLPEIDGASPGMTGKISGWMWILGVGLLFLIIGLTMRRLFRQKN